MEFLLIVFIPAIFSSFPISLSDTTTILPPQLDSSNNGIASELQVLKLQIARLESVLEETVKGLNTRSVYLEEREQFMDALGQKIHDLQVAMLAIKDDSSSTKKRIHELEEEVRLLWAASRKNNFDIHVLQSKAQATDHKLEELELQVQKMDDIVTEYWIHIRHLEQALQAAELWGLNAQKLVKSRKKTFTEFADRIWNHLHKITRIFFWNEGSSFKSYGPEIVHYFERIFSAAKINHQQLQRDIKLQMKRHDFTAAFANDELVFFAASALITFPIIVITNMLLGYWQWQHGILTAAKISPS